MGETKQSFPVKFFFLWKSEKQMLPIPKLLKGGKSNGEGLRWNKKLLFSKDLEIDFIVVNLMLITVTHMLHKTI